MKIISKSGGKFQKWIVPILSLLILVALSYYIKDLTGTNSFPYEYLQYEKVTAISSENGKIFQSNDTGVQLTHLLPVQIDAFYNSHTYQKIFFIPKDSTVKVQAVGEAADYSTNPFLFKSYDNDGIEVYFDMKNEKFPFFDIGGDDRQYRILWKTLEISGQNINAKGVTVSESDPTETTYVMNLSFPWKSLGYFSPKISNKLGFDIALIDCDGEPMKAELNWHSKSEDAWKNTSTYGTMILGARGQKSTDSNCVLVQKCVRLSVGVRKMYWKDLPIYHFQYVSRGYVRDSLDLSGKFQAQWDKRNLYLRVFVCDDVKTYAHALFDYGWIEDCNRKIIWTMDVNNSKYAGGAIKNRKMDSVFRIKKGYYILKYHTDESHAPCQWDDAPPVTSFYGIRLAYK